MCKVIVRKCQETIFFTLECMNNLLGQPLELVRAKYDDEKCQTVQVMLS